MSRRLATALRRLHPLSGVRWHFDRDDLLD